MLKELTRYSGVVTKIRAKERNRLDESDYKTMIAMESVPEVIGYLKEHSSFSPFLRNVDEREMHRGQLERLLHRAMQEDFCRLYRFIAGDARRFLDIYLVYFETELMKRILYQIYGGEPEDFTPILVDEFFERHTKVPFGKLVQCTTRQEYLEALKDTDFYELLADVMEKDGTLFDVAMRLDLYYYTTIAHLMEKLDKTDRIAIGKVFGYQVDLINLVWIYRLKASYRADAGRIMGYLIPTLGNLSHETLARLARAADIPAFVEMVNQTPHRGLFDAPENGGLERTYAERLLSAQKRILREHPMSVAAITASEQLKQFEMQNIITVVEGVRYNLPAENIMERLVL